MDYKADKMEAAMKELRIFNQGGIVMFETAWRLAMEAASEDVYKLRQALAAAEAECAAARKTLVRTSEGADAQRWGQFVTETVGNDATRARLGLGKIGEAR